MYWRYVVLNRLDKEKTGVLYGNRKEILLELQSKNFNVISLQPDIFEAVRLYLSSRKFNAKQMSVLFRDFANMLETGLTLTHIFNTLREQTLDAHLASLYVDMGKRLGQGESLAVCFKATGKFPDLVISVLSAGESSGQLPTTMRTLSEYYQVLGDLKARVLGACVYPVIIISLLMASLVYLSLNVIPHLRDVLPASALNSWLTLAMLGLANFLEHFWYVLLIFPVVVVAVFLFLKTIYREKIDALVFKIPYFGYIFRDYELSIVFLSLWVLHKAGVTINVALRKIIETNTMFAAKQLEVCRVQMVAGLSISESLQHNSFFPKLITDTIRIGEETGRVNEYIERIYKSYKEMFQSRLNILIEIVQPALLVFCGAIFFLIIAAFFQPIYANLGNITAATMH